MPKNSLALFTLMVFAFLLLLEGCGSPPSLTPPAGQPGPMQVATTFPTIRTTSTDLPIPTPSPLPLPSRAEMRQRFEADVDPLIQKLLAAKSDPAIPVSAGDELFYIPQTERLYTVQTILGFTHTASSSRGRRVYVLYNVLRGEDLGPESGDGMLRTTQAVISSLRLILESDGKFSLIEEEVGIAGEGSTSHEDLVTTSVLPLAELPADMQGIVERDLEEIIGYACGIDMRGDLAESTRAVALIQTLDSSEWADKRQGLQALANLTSLPPSLAPILLAQLNDERQTYELVQVLAKMSTDPDVFKGAIEAARSPDPKTRKGAAALLAVFPGQEAITVPILMGLLRDEDGGVRGEAAWQLGSSNASSWSNLGSNNVPGMEPLESDNAPDVVQLLSAALVDPDETYRLAVLETLGYMLKGAAPAVPALVATLPGSSPEVQREIYHVLSIIGEDAQDAVPALEQALLAETDRAIFTSLITALAEIIGEEATLPLLTEAFASPNPEIRAEICSRLGSGFAGVPGTLSLVASALGDSDESVRGAAAYAITNILDQRSSAMTPGWPGDEERSIIPALFQALHDPAYTTKDQAGLALTMLNDTRAVELDEAIKNEDLIVVSRVYRLYIERGEAGTEAVLIKALEKYGSEQMAIDFLNCGNSLLEAAAKKWADTHHYTIWTAPGGSGTPMWGNGQ